MLLPALTLDDEHVYRYGGQVVPGVTEVLSDLADFSMVDPDVLARKADLGRRVHFAVQLDHENDLDESTIEHDVAPYLAAWRRFCTEHVVEVLAGEQQVHHVALGYAGTLDLVIRVDGGPPVCTDVKTPVRVPRAAGPQTAAYVAARNSRGEQPTVLHRAALKLGDDGRFRFLPLQDPNDFAVFCACLTRHRFLKANPQ